MSRRIPSAERARVARRLAICERLPADRAAFARQIATCDRDELEFMRLAMDVVVSCHGDDVASALLSETAWRRPRDLDRAVRGAMAVQPCGRLVETRL